jgi:DNA-binding PadR family transcriptional regulator
VKTTATDVPDNLILELRRGAVILAVLAQLRNEQYGYSLKKSLGDAGLAMDEGTLYPLLRRLESQGLLRSRWRVEEAHPRRYYRLSSQGEAMLPALRAEWDSLTEAIRRVIE